jgi:hypothetical protein
LRATPSPPRWHKDDPARSLPLRHHHQLPVEGDLYLTDVVSNQPLKEGSRVTLQYDPIDPRRNSLNHPPRERKAFLISACCAGVLVLMLLVIALFGL